MRTSPSPARVALLLGGLLTACATAAAQEPVARDTIVVIQRDTLVVIQRDTVFVAPAPAPPSGVDEGSGRPAYGTRPRRIGEDDAAGQRDDDYLDARAARRARLEQLRRERADRLSLLGDARTTEHALAYYVYPTRLLEIDFPAATFGVAYVKDGRIGAMGSVGVLTRPVNNFRNIPEGRGPVRGLDIGGEFRYYVSPLYRRFPVYLGGGGSYSWAPVRYTRFIASPENTFERLGAADATARRIRVSAIVGWEFRTEKGLALDLTTGLEYHGRGVFTDNVGLALALENNRFTNAWPNEYNPAVYPVMRIGVGFGKW